MADDSPKRVSEILDRLEEAAGKADDVTIEDMVHALGERSYGPFLMVPALLDISPLGSIPGVPTALALVLLLIAAQVAIGRKHLWLPGFVETRRVGSSRLQNSVRALRGIGAWMDRLFHGRLQWLLAQPFIRACGLACVGLALLMPPLEVFPFATTLVTAPIAIFGLALLFRDGLLMVVGFTATLAAAAGALWVFFG